MKNLTIYFICKVKIFLKTLNLVTKWPFKLCLGDIVNYKGERYALIQGVNAPYWNISALNSDKYLKNIHIEQFKKEKTFRNLLHDLSSGYRFYMEYWYKIWVLKEFDKLTQKNI